MSKRADPLRGKRLDKGFGDLDSVRGHKQPYEALFGMSADDICYHGHVMATSPEKARKKARRIQIKTGWPHVTCAALPHKVYPYRVEDSGPLTRFSKAHRCWRVFVDGRWIRKT